MRRFRRIATALCLSLVMTSCKKKNPAYSGDVVAELLGSSDVVLEIINEIQDGYANDVSREKLEAGAINGMLKTLDDHSAYITQDEYDSFNKSTRGAFLGIGIEIRQLSDGIEITSVIDDSPAAVAGLNVGDVITSVDGEGVSDIGMKKAVSKLSSDRALKVVVNALRNKTENLKFELKKSVIQLQSVKLDFADDIAIIKISHFNEGTLNEVSSAVSKLL
ncbi:MAG: PDZ domain-containing protein, partial [Holosporales bacterium]|nr:PDZ domain-containing protein [Holosporales bacterium]